MRERAHWLVANLIANHSDGEADLVSELAGPLPLQVICDMMGIPEEDHQRIFHWTNVILGFGDPDLTLDFEEFMQVSMDIGAYATALAEDRRVNHHDDLTTSLVEAEVDGERLTSQEIASFFILLVVAGNETRATRSVTEWWPCRVTPSSGNGGGPTSTPWRPPRWRKSYGGPHRWSTCDGP